MTHLQVFIEQSDLSSRLIKSIKKFAWLITSHGTLDFIAWSSKSPVHKILITVSNKLQNRTIVWWEYFHRLHFFNNLVTGTKKQIKLQFCENKDTKNYLTIVRHLSSLSYRPEMQIFQNWIAGNYLIFILS